MKFNNPVSSALMQCYSNSVLYSVSCFMQVIAPILYSIGHPTKHQFYSSKKQIVKTLRSLLQVNYLNCQNGTVYNLWRSILS